MFNYPDYTLRCGVCGQNPCSCYRVQPQATGYTWSPGIPVDYEKIREIVEQAVKDIMTEYMIMKDFGIEKFDEYEELKEKAEKYDKWIMLVHEEMGDEQD